MLGGHEYGTSSQLTLPTAPAPPPGQEGDISCGIGSVLPTLGSYNPGGGPLGALEEAQPNEGP